MDTLDLRSQGTSESRNAFRAIAIFFVAAAGAFSVEIYLAVQSQHWQVFAVAGIGGFVAVAAAISIYLSRHSRPKFAVKFLIAASLLSVLVAPLLIAGFGLILGLGTVLVVLTIAPPILSPKEVNWALIASVGVAVVAGGIDLLSPASQLTFPAAQNLILITGSVMVVAYSLLTIRQFSSYTLPTKLIVAFLTVSLIPLGLLAYLNANQTRSTLIDTENQVLFAAASQTATSIDTFIDDTRIAIRTEAQLPTIVKYLSLPANQRSGSREEAEAKETLQKLSHKNRVFIESYALLDHLGTNLINTNEENIGQNLADRDYFEKPIKTGLDYVSPVEFTSQDGDPVLYFSNPVRNENKEIIGVLSMCYKAAVLQQLVVKNNGLFGEQSFGILLDEYHIRLAHGGDPGLRFKPVVLPDSATVAHLQADHRLPDALTSEFSTDLPDFNEGLSSRITEPQFTTYLATADDRPYSAVAAELKRQPWLVVFVQPQEIFLTPIQKQIQNALFLAIAIAGAVAAVAFAVGQLLANPLVHLTKTVTQFTAGDLSARTNIKTTDETGILAASFNTMAEQVGNLLTGLEERTHELELNQSVILAVSELSKAGLDLERLLNEAVSTLQTRFGLYQVMVMLIDPEQETLVFRAGSGDVTDQLHDRSFVIPLEHKKSVMARAVRLEKAVVIDDVDSETNFMEHPLLPKTRSEVTIPLVAHSITLGVLDIQDSTPFRFSQLDVETFVTLARYLGTALENAYLFEQIHEAKDAAESANKAKSVFLANMSHELRTPLHAIIGYSEMLEEEAEDTGQTDIIPDLQRIQTASAHLLTLINGVLDLSKIEAGRMELYLENFDIVTLVDAVIATVHPVIEKNGNIFKVDYAENLGTMLADPLKVRQILFNLLSNAAKFTTEGAIKLQISRGIPPSTNGNSQSGSDIDWISFSVKDTGIGLTSEQKINIFKAFTQADMSTTRKYGGTGLGLAISQRLCQMMGGYITVESEPKQGSTFIAHLPTQVISDQIEPLARQVVTG